jgi:tRNA threonylcarbamoyl adenosine modification protein (Sua5/YciO/YrdC/YwlC family)
MLAFLLMHLYGKINLVEFSTIEKAAASLKTGEAVIFPTDTVYGLGVLPSAAASPALLFELKKRPQDKPVAWLVGGVSDLARYGQNVPEYALDLAKEHWPGALTLIVNASAQVPSAYSSDANTIGLRMPNNATALQLIELAGAPLATTSANISGKPAPANVEELDSELCGRVTCVVSGEECEVGIASTVVDCTGDEPVVLRQGSIVIE